MGSRGTPRLSTAASVGAVVLFSATLVILRGRPSIDDDAGIFLSVAARLVRGDHLYTSVWDNKAPLFYYAQALSVAVCGWRGPFLLDVLWLSLAATFMWSLLQALEVSFSTKLAGAIAYPVMLTGVWYHAGYSELPALALALAIMSFGVRHRALAAGCLLGVALFFRLDYGLILLTAMAVAVALGANARGAWRRDARRGAVGLLASASSLAVVLAVRGELVAYIQTTLSQFGYPDRALAQAGQPPGIVGHLMVVASAVSESRFRVVLFWLMAAGVVGLAAAEFGRAARGRPRASRSRPDGALAVLCLTTALATVATLAVSALWDHSLEPVAIAATFGACLLASRVESAVSRRPLRLTALGATLVACCIASGGLSMHASGGSPEGGRPISDWWRRPVAVSAEALNDAADTYGAGRNVSYARLGGNTDDGHAAFIRPALELTCPVFHQYPFSTNLDDVLECLRDRRPDLVLVGPFLAPRHLPGTEHWDAFVAGGRLLLQTFYVKAVTMPSRGGTVEVWRRR